MFDNFEDNIQYQKLIKVGLLETYLFKPAIYMPLFRNSDGWIDNLTMENL